MDAGVTGAQDLVYALALEDLAAMEEAIAAGIRVNVTLLFSDPHYLRTALAERLQREGAGRFSADWAALLSAITEKAGMSPGPSGA